MIWKVNALLLSMWVWDIDGYRWDIDGYRWISMVSMFESNTMMDEGGCVQ